MNMLELKNKIKSHLLAGYSGLYIHSGEDARVDAMLQDAAKQLTLVPKEWNLGYGWVDFFNKQPLSSQSQNTELAQSLPTLLDDDLDGKLFIIKDARSALENQPLAVARLKQMLNRIQRHHRGKAAVVLVSETLHIPASLESQVTLFSLALPRGEEISDQLDSICRQLNLSVPEKLQQRLHAACSGLSQEEIRSALVMASQKHDHIDDSALALIQHEKEQIIAKGGVLEILNVNERAEDIGGLENLKAWLSRRAQIFRRLGEAREARVQAPKGVLIAGMPGCGKSLTAKAAADLFQLPLLRLDIGSLLGKYVGESEHNMRRALTMAESVSPCILWIDELEKAFVGMNSGNGSEVSSRLFGYFLTWMQEKSGAVFVIATANNIAALPPELLRKGRFDEVFYVGFPNAVERGAILDIHLKGESLNLGKEDRSKLISQCRDYAGADIQNAINEARETAFLENRALKIEDIESAIKLTVPLRETLREQVAKYEELFEKLKLKPASTSDGLSVAEMIQMADSDNFLHREQVANSEDCPNDLLEKLAKDKEVKILEAVYKNPNCPEKVLTQRINITEDKPEFKIGLLHLACIHPRAPHNLLAVQFDLLKLPAEHTLLLAKTTTEKELMSCLLKGGDNKIRKELALNTYLTKELQQELASNKDLAKEYHHNIAKPPFSLFPIFDGISKLSEPKTIREYLASNTSLDPELQEQLAYDGTLRVRKRLADLEHLSETAQLILAQDEKLEVLDALVRNKNLSADAQVTLAQSEHVSIRCALAMRPDLTDNAQQYLVKDIEEVLITLASNQHINAKAQMSISLHESDRVLISLASNVALSGDAQAWLLNGSSISVRIELAGNDNLADGIIEKLIKDDYEAVRRELALQEKLTKEQQLQLANDSAFSVRDCIASNNNLHPDIQKLLAIDNSSDVHESLTRFCKLSEETQLILVKDEDQDVRQALAKNKNLCEAAQILLAQDEQVDVRCALAECPALTIGTMQRLSKDLDEVQATLASHPSLSTELQLMLSQHDSEYVRESLALNSSLAIEIQNTLVRDRHIRVREALAKNKNLSEEVIEKLIQEEHDSIKWNLMGYQDDAVSQIVQKQLAFDPRENIRRQLAWKDNLSNEVQKKLANDVTEIQQELARNTCISESIQVSLLGKGTYQINLALAKNRSLTSSMLEQLSEKADIEIRACLASHKSLTNEVFNKLIGDTEEIKMNLARNQNLSEAQYSRLYDIGTENIQEILAKNPKIGESLMTKIFSATDRENGATTSTNMIRLALAENPMLPFSLQAALIQNCTSLELLLALANNSSLSEVFQNELAAHKDIDVLKRLASNENLSEAIKQKLISYPDPDVRISLLGSGCDHYLVMQLLQDPDISVRCAVAETSWLEKSAQVQLANDPSREVRMGLLQSEFNFINKLHPLAQEILARDSDQEIRELLALYPALAPKAQTILAADESTDVRDALAMRSEAMFSTITLYLEAQQRLAKFH